MRSEGGGAQNLEAPQSFIYIGVLGRYINLMRPFHHYAFKLE